MTPSHCGFIVTSEATALLLFTKDFPLEIWGLYYPQFPGMTKNTSLGKVVCIIAFPEIRLF